MDHCTGGNLAQKIQELRERAKGFKEEQILQWMVQTCMALKCIDEKGLLHKDLTPQRILLTELGTISLGGFGKLGECERHDAETTTSKNAAISYRVLKPCKMAYMTTKELHQLLKDIFQTRSFRPTASEILGRDFIIRFLMRKSKATVEDLQANLDKLKTLADGLEREHQGTTIASLTVIGAAGGIPSILGLCLIPFTF